MWGPECILDVSAREHTFVPWCLWMACVCVCVCVFGCVCVCYLVLVCERVVGVEFDVDVEIGFQYLVATCSFALACSQVLLPRWSNLFLHVFFLFQKDLGNCIHFFVLSGPILGYGEEKSRCKSDTQFIELESARIASVNVMVWCI